MWIWQCFALPFVRDTRPRLPLPWGTERMKASENESKRLSEKERELTVLFCCDEMSIGSHSLCRNIHIGASGVIVELHSGFSIRVCHDIGLPPDCTAVIVGHRRNHAIVLGLEFCWNVEPLEIGAASSFLACSVIIR